MSKHIFRRVYLWEWPVRIYHWVTALAVVALAATGLMIGAPVAVMSTREAYAGYWFGTVRFVHSAPTSCSCRSRRSTSWATTRWRPLPTRSSSC